MLLFSCIVSPVECLDNLITDLTNEEGKVIGIEYNGSSQYFEYGKYIYPTLRIKIYREDKEVLLDSANLNLVIYSDGLLKGSFFLLRIILVIFLSTLLTVSTSTTDINLGLEWVLHPLSIIKIPVSEIAMMFSLTLRFIPTLLIETNKIMKAQASRGIDFNEGSFVEKVKQVITLLIPMFFISITRAEDLANAMEARGYVIGGKRTNIDELKFRWKDLIAFLVVLSILTMSILLMVGL